MQKKKTTSISQIVFSLEAKKQDTTLKIAIFCLNLTAASTKHKGPALTGSNQNTLYKSYRTWLKRGS